MLGQAAYLSVYEFFGFFSPQAYLIVWVPRVAFQIIFFGYLTRYVGGNDLLLFALVGNAAYLAAQAVLTFATASMTWELRAGTVPLLIASPSSPLLVFTGRNLFSTANGVVSGLVSLLVGTLFGLQLAPAQVPVITLLLVLISFSSYGLAIFLGSIVLRAPGLRNAASSLVGLSLLAISGVNVPLAVLPDALQSVALALPLAHGLLALRGALADAPVALVLTESAKEAVVGLAYYVAAALSLSIFVRRARHHGTLDFQ